MSEIFGSYWFYDIEPFFSGYFQLWVLQKDKNNNSKNLIHLQLHTDIHSDKFIFDNSLQFKQ